MNRKTHNNRRLKKASLLLIIVMLSLFPAFLMNFSTFDNQSKNLTEDEILNDKNYDIDNLKSSALGNDTWWDYSFRYRRLVSINNPYAYSFTDYGVSVSFNYTYMRENGYIYQDDLDDIRVVENGDQRSYYLVKDYPEIDLATIYFDTNISQLTTEIDTYVYFGNNTLGNEEASDPSDSFGWVKNGNFELDIDLSDKFVPYGWTFSHNPVDTIKGVNNPSPNPSNSSAISIQFFVNKLIDNPEGAERVAHGSYAYKWGARTSLLDDPTVHDYAGTLFSYPFTVPNVEGGQISLNVYRNIRTHRFERPKNVGTINKDGYFIRILNGSSLHYDTNPDNHNDNDISPTYENYAESYDGNAYYNVPARKWDDETTLFDFPNHLITTDTLSDTDSDGQLTGYININLTKYMGKEIFFEIGVWGDESDATYKEKSAFFQVDDVGFNYTLTASIDEVQAHNSTITIIARDVDGRLVSNAEVMLVNNSVAKGLPGYEHASGITDSNGRVTFNHLPNGFYNITANYTRNSQEIEVYSSFNLGTGPYYFNGIFYTEEIFLDLWTIDFEIIDWDGIPLSQGFIEILNTSGGTLIDNLTLNSNGKTTFIWENTAKYFFRVFYKNEDYIGGPFLLNESYIYRSLYDKDGEKFRDHSIQVINTNINPKGSNSYSVNELIYTNGSRIEFGNKKLIKLNVTLATMVDQLINISIYYIDADNSTGTGDENLIYFEDGYSPGEDSDFIELDIPSIKNSKLESEDFEVYGLLLQVNGLNFSVCNGIIDIETLETCNVFNRTHLARLNIRVVREESGVEVPYPALIKVLDNKTGLPLVNLTSRLDRDGYAFTTNTDLPFWFLKDRAYNISLNSLNTTNVNFNVTDFTPYQWYPEDNNGYIWYNFTLYGGSSVEFNLIFTYDVNLTNYLTAFFNTSSTPEAFWGEDLSFAASLFLTEDNGQTWDPITSPTASCTLSIREVGSEIILITEFMIHGVGTPNFTLTIISSRLSAGGSEKFYTVTIEGLYPGYPEPSSQNFLIKVKSIPTTISAHDYDTQVELSNKLYTAYYDDIVSIMIQYTIYGSVTTLDNADLTYEWLGLAPIDIYADSINIGFYTFTLNTSDAQSTGLKVISITASYENYTTKSDFLVYLNILERKTTLNNETADITYMRPPDVWVQDTKIFRFTYRDANRDTVLGGLSTASFIWEELYDNGTKIEGVYGSGELTELSNKTYLLDFNTEMRPVGNFFLFITLKKDNYEEKNVLINLKIILREFSDTVLINSQLLEDDSQISVNQGAEINFDISLTDDSRNYIALEGATVELYLGHTGDTLPLTPSLTEPGVYEIEFGTGNIDTFIAAKTFVAILYISADNFTSVERTIIITVKMEEIFPGMPTFYFILITASIIGVVGSIVGYRVIQQARIPKHVKKIRKLKGLIKSKKKITEIPTIPTKEQMMAKLFGNDWKEIGLSLDEALGIQDLKPKKLPLKDKISKERGEQ